MFKSILNWLLGSDNGHFHVYRGFHEIYIPTRVRPHKAWITFTSEGTDGCGQIPVDWVSYRLERHGIFFQLDVKTNRCNVEWFVTN